jgi:hypothetical protein
MACAACRPSQDATAENKSQRARQALVVALDAWRNEADAAPLDHAKVQFTDSLSENRRLADYEIVGELPAQGSKRFEVLLHESRDDSSEPVDQLAQYVVFGIDPIWVMRQEDYDMISHWDHPMPGTASDAAAPDTPPGAAP